MKPAERAYRSASVDGVSQIGVHIALFDEMALRLCQAAAAVTEGNIEDRCAASNRVLLLLGHLETWTGQLGDAALGKSLDAFYAFLRAQTLALQTSAKSAGFEELAALLFATREAWQQKEQMMMQSAAQPVTAGLGLQEGGYQETAPAAKGWCG